MLSNETAKRTTKRTSSSKSSGWWRTIRLLCTPKLGWEGSWSMLPMMFRGGHCIARVHWLFTIGMMVVKFLVPSLECRVLEWPVFDLTIVLVAVIAVVIVFFFTAAATSWGHGRYKFSSEGLWFHQFTQSFDEAKDIPHRFTSATTANLTHSWHPCHDIQGMECIHHPCFTKCW